MLNLMKKNMDYIAEIRRELLRQLFSASIFSLFFSILLAALLSYAQRNVINQTIIITWFSLVVLPCLWLTKR